MEIYGHLQELYDLKDLSKRAYATWYQAFENIDYEVGQKMVDLYFINETKRPRPADLLKVKGWAYKEIMKGKEYLNQDGPQVPTEKCEVCKNTGIVQIEKEINTRYYTYAYACKCSLGAQWNIKQAGFDELRGLKQYYNGVWMKPERMKMFYEKYKEGKQ